MRAHRFSLSVLCILLGAAQVNAQSVKNWEKVATAGKFQFVWIAKAQEANKTVYEEAIQALCKPNVWCGLNFWSDRRMIPQRLPMSDAQANAQVAVFVYNPNTKHREMLWACRINPNPKECFS